MKVNLKAVTKVVGSARLVPAALILSLGFGLGSVGPSLVYGQQATQPALASPAELSRTFVGVSKQVKPAVVNIDVVERAKKTAMRGDDLPMIPGFPGFGRPEPRTQRGTGSGVIISPDGYILTNNHVAGEADEIKVKLSDGREVKARRVGTDPETDLALIKIDEQNLPFARLGDSTKLEQGEWVVALGSPFGLAQTMTAGIVSATSRDLGNSPYDNYIQTDASINPGNSGGPLINMNGEVIGINTMIFSKSGGSEGIGFAIPSNLAKKVYAQLAKSGKVSRGYLGLNLQPVTPAIAKSVGFAGKDGVLVGDLAENSPAGKAGLRSGDVITEFDGQAVKTPKQLTEVVADTPVGKAVNVRYFRDGQAQAATIKLGERPGAKDASPETEADAGQGAHKLGVSVATVTAAIAQELKLKVNSGAVIQSVAPDSPAAEAGLKTGDVIHRINRQPVASAQDLISSIQSLKGEAEVVLQVERGGRLLFLTVTLG